MTDILKKIIATKKEELKLLKAEFSIKNLEDQIKYHEFRNFLGALKKKILLNKPAIIAEIKKASPSKGVLSKDFNPSNIAAQYEKNGAACLSVLTDVQFFHGSKQFLNQAKYACSLPVLRKDFIIDEYQILESKSIGADCILLIASILTKNQLIDFENVALDLGMNVLVETHNIAELESALNMKTDLIGINNRNLNSFKTDLKTTIEMLSNIPNNKIVITESGISSKEDILRMRDNNVNVFLIGEHFMIQKDPGEALRKLID